VDTSVSMVRLKERGKTLQVGGRRVKGTIFFTRGVTLKPLIIVREYSNGVDAETRS